MVLISRKKSRFPNYERKVAVKLWKGERKVEIRLRTRVRACISWKMGKKKQSSYDKQPAHFCREMCFLMAFWHFVKIMTWGPQNSKMGPHLVLIFLEESLFYYYNAI